MMTHRSTKGQTMQHRSHEAMAYLTRSRLTLLYKISDTAGLNVCVIGLHIGKGRYVTAYTSTNMETSESNLRLHVALSRSRRTFPEQHEAVCMYWVDK